MVVPVLLWARKESEWMRQVVEKSSGREVPGGYQARFLFISLLIVVRSHRDVVVKAGGISETETIAAPETEAGVEVATWGELRAF